MERPVLTLNPGTAIANLEAGVGEHLHRCRPVLVGDSFRVVPPPVRDQVFRGDAFAELTASGSSHVPRLSQNAPTLTASRPAKREGCADGGTALCALSAAVSCAAAPRPDTFRQVPGKAARARCGSFRLPSRPPCYPPAGPHRTSFHQPFRGRRRSPRSR